MNTPREILMRMTAELIMADSGKANSMPASAKVSTQEVILDEKLDATQSSLRASLPIRLKVTLPVPALATTPPQSPIEADLVDGANAEEDVFLSSSLPQLYRPQEAKPAHSSPASLSDGRIQQLRSLLNLPTDSYDLFDVSVLLPSRSYLFEAPILASVDCEAWEDDRASVQEVGFSLLDTRKLEDAAPGPVGSNWLGKIEYHHFVTEDYKHLVNRRQLKGCPDNFIFGESQIVKEAEYHDILSKLLTREDDLHDGEGEKHYRRIILVGHSLAEDVKYLNLLGFDVVKHIQSLHPSEYPDYAEPLGPIDSLTPPSSPPLSPTAVHDQPALPTSLAMTPDHSGAPNHGRPQPRSYPIPTLDTHLLVQALSPHSTLEKPVQKLILSVGKLVYMFTPPGPAMLSSRIIASSPEQATAPELTIQPSEEESAEYTPLLASPAASVVPPYLHNAGNDAAYTLHALLLLAFRCGESIRVPFWPSELLTIAQQKRRDERQLLWLLSVKLGSESAKCVWERFRQVARDEEGGDAEEKAKKEKTKSVLTEAQKERRKRSRKNAKENRKAREKEAMAKAETGRGYVVDGC